MLKQYHVCEGIGSTLLHGLYSNIMWITDILLSICMSLAIYNLYNKLAVPLAFRYSLK